MCTNMRMIYNRYSRRHVLVKCGKCDACRQEQACRRAARIRNNVKNGNICLFITLTYTNDFVPYVKRSELDSGNLEINVYRKCSIREVFDRHSGITRFKKVDGEVCIGKVPLYEALDKSRWYPKLTGMSSEYIGVCWYPDIQKFYKRLRINLKRHYNYEKYFSFFSCTEYGGHTYRPHSHGLLFVGLNDEALFRSAIVQAWPYADKRRTAKFVECAKDAASYVASYVNSNSNLLPLMSLDSFKQKHSASKDFGCTLDCFKLPQILEKIDRGDLFYYRQQKFDGATSTIALPIPKYILYRYFPVCKGFSWLSSSQLRTILFDPQMVGEILNDNDYYANKLSNPIYSFTPRESYRIFVRLENCYQRFHRETGLSRVDYVYYYLKVWPLYNAIVEKLMHEQFLELQGDYSSFYENANEVQLNPDIAPTLRDYLPNLCIDPNKRFDIVNKTNNFRSLFSRMNKQRKVTNLVMSQMDYDV